MPKSKQASNSNHAHHNDPIALFKTWFDEAQKLEVKEPAAVALATATKDGLPSIRIMLLRGVDHRGFCFFTNITSRKGKELLDNPNAALCFHWDSMDRQVRVEGTIERVTDKEADDYFASRERGSQLGAWASKQSMVMSDDHDLPNRLQEITDQFKGQPIQRPPFWSGFRLVPKRIEFWVRGDYRLHKRILYTKMPEGWAVDRLYP